MARGLDGSRSDSSPSEQHNEPPAEPTAPARPTPSCALRPSPAGGSTYHESAKSDTLHGIEPDEGGDRVEGGPQEDEEQKRKRESESRRRQEEDDEAFARQCQAELDAEERDGAAAASTDGDEELAQRLASDVGDTQEGSVPPYKAGDKVEGF